MFIPVTSNLFHLNFKETIILLAVDWTHYIALSFKSLRLISNHLAN